MAFTGELGTVDSQLGQFQLGVPDNPTQDASNSLTLTQALNVGLTLHTSNTLTFTQDAALGVPQQDVAQTLTLTQVTVTSLHSGQVNQTLTLSQTARSQDVRSQTVSQSLTLTQAVHRTIQVPASSTLTLTSTGSEHKVGQPVIAQALALVQTVRGNTVRARTLTNTLVFADSFTVPLPLQVQRFTGQPGQSPFFLARAAQFAIRRAGTCTLILEAASQALILRCPEFGDSEASTATVNVKKTYTGATYVYVRGKTGVRKLKYSFLLGRQKSLQLEDFLQAHGNELLRLTNHKGEIWLGNITSSPFAFTANQRYLNEEEQIGISLELQGVKIFGSSSPC